MHAKERPWTTMGAQGHMQAQLNWASGPVMLGCGGPPVRAANAVNR